MEHFRKIINKPLGEILIQQGVLSRTALESVLAFQKEKGVLLGEALVMMRLGTEEDVVQALTCQYGFPYLPLAQYHIPAQVLKVLDAETCQRYCLIPIDAIGRSLTLAMANPLNIQALEQVEKSTGCWVQTFVSTATDIHKAIARYYVV